MTRIVVDRDKCMGHTKCIAATPQLFELDEDGYSRPLVDEVTGRDEQEAVLAARACPEGAITLVGGADPSSLA
jgi:ferredoxin